MEKRFLLMLLTSLCFNWQLFAQVQKLDINFDNGQNSFAVINMDAAQPSYTMSVVNGALKIVTLRRAGDWSFMGMFSQNLDISVLPTIQFKVKASVTGEFLVRLKSTNLSDPAAEKVTIGKTVTLTGGDDYKDFFFDLSADIASTPNFDPLKIVEIHIECSSGSFLNPYSGTVELDFLKFGYPKPLPFKGTGFIETFDGVTVPIAVIQNAKYTFSNANSALNVNVDRENRWFGFNYEMDGSYDISANPVVNVDVKTETDMILQVFLIDDNGNGYQSVLTGSQYKYDELTLSKSEYRSARILKGNDFMTVSFDFSLAKSTILDLKKIAKIKFVSNGTAITFKGKYAISEIRMGEQAVKRSYIGQVAEHSYLKNTLGTREILIPEIKNASGLTVTGASALITAASLTPITYTNAVEDGASIQYGFAKLSFTLVADATGTDTIVIKATGNTGFSENTMKFAIHVRSNNPPTINPVANIVVQNGKRNEIRLTGITSGDIQAKQILTLTAFSDNTSVIDTIHIDYSSPDHYGRVWFSSSSEGIAKITLSVKDNLDSVATASFTVTSYKSINQTPVVDKPVKLTVTNTSGEQSVMLTGIGDGDNSSQQLTFQAISSNPAVIPDPAILFVQGSNSASMTFTPTGTTGTTNITVSVTDNGGNAENDGNKTTSIIIPVEVIVYNPTGLDFDLSAGNALSYFAPEKPGIVYFLAIVDTLGSKAMRVIMKGKSTWDGIWMDIPVELNLSALPVLSYEIFSKDKPTWHWNYFYNAEGSDPNVDRNIQNSGDHQIEAPANTWTTITFDYRQPGDMNNSGGTPIDASRISGLLINMHDGIPAWPFTSIDGVFYIRNIKFGDKAVYTAEQIFASVNPIGNQSAFENGGSQTIHLSGISNGKKGIDNVTITASSSSPGVSEINLVSAVNPDGTASLTFSPLASGATVFNIKVEATGAEPISISSIVTVIKNSPSGYAKVLIDKTRKYQTMRGFGTFLPDSRFADLYAKDLGASVVRIGIIGNQWEPKNDNDDPNITNMEGFNYGAFDWDYLRYLKANGVETFIITSWSPPAWMKRNFSLDHKEQAIEWEKTDNILEPYYYEEFAESMAALVKAMKQEAGIDILAIGLQNEPYFNEPYASAILGGAQFVELIKIVGDRFNKEGVSHVGFYMPEQVFGVGGGGYSCEEYLQTLKADPIADEYCNYFAVHGYDATGITPGFPAYDRWTRMSNLAQQGNHPKETWMTETYIGYNDWLSALDLAGAIHGSLWAGKISLWSNWSFDGTQVTKNLPNSSFYTSKNYYKFIRPGAVMLDASSDNSNLLVTSFENVDGKLAIVVINKGTRAVPARIYGNNLPELYHIYRTTMSDNCLDAGILNTIENTMIFPPSSVITLVAEANSSLAMKQLADTTVKMNSGETVLLIEGISNTFGGTDSLTLEFVNSNPGLLSNISISAIGGDGKASLSFTPASNQTGVAQIKLSLTNYYGIKRQVIFYIFVFDATSASAMNIMQYKIYPNPASDLLNIELSPNQFKELVITDITGRLVFRKNILSDHFSINVNNWNKGVYVIRMKGDKKSEMERFVIE
jgi:O-glycosyl hydrolase